MRECYGCEERSVWCHGKDEDGNWRCEYWARHMAAKEREYALWRAERDADNYQSDNILDHERRVRAHHK